MSEYKFAGENGACPSCNAFGRKWYIQDKDAGDGKYEYCLMSMPGGLPDERIFKSKNEAAAWLNGYQDVKIEDDVADFIISMAAVNGYRFPDRMLLLHDKREYIYNKTRNSITEMIKRRQDTGWFDKYYDCLNMAKEILKKQEGQMSLFE